MMALSKTSSSSPDQLIVSWFLNAFSNTFFSERRAQLSILQTSVRNQHLSYESPGRATSVIDDDSADEITEKTNTTYEKPSEAGSESDLNQVSKPFFVKNFENLVKSTF